MASLMSNSSFGKIPSGTTANRPASPAVGDQYYNGTIGALEVYTSNGWKSLTTSGGDTAGRPANPYLGQSYFNGETARLELYTSNGWQNIVQETPGVSSVSGHYYESDSYGTFTISGTNFVSGAIAYAVGTNGIEYQAQTTTYNSLVQLTATFANLSGSYEPYDIKVVNPSNLFGLLPDAFYINESPIWSTASGSLGTFNNGSVSYQLSATDDESDTLTYSISSGSLPTGLSLSSSGLISGTNTAVAGTYTFTVTVSDGINAIVSRSFSMIVPIPTVTGGTLSSDSTYYYRTFTGNSDLVVSGSKLSVNYLLVGGGGSSGGHYNGNYEGGGGGAGGMLSGTSTLSVGTYPVTIGAGGTAATGSGNTNGVNSTAISLTAFGGGLGGPGFTNGGNGGSGGGAGWGGTYGTGTSGQGNNGGSPGGSLNGGGGGGGKASAGGTGASGGNGGAGEAWINGTYYAGGGAGGRHGAGTSEGGGIGGVGGGGNGQPSTVSGTGNPGTANTGGGAGGAWASSNSAGSNGGSGIFIVAYTKASVGG